MPTGLTAKQEKVLNALSELFDQGNTWYGGTVIRREFNNHRHCKRYEFWLWPHIRQEPFLSLAEAKRWIRQNPDLLDAPCCPVCDRRRCMAGEECCDRQECRDEVATWKREEVSQ